MIPSIRCSACGGWAITAHLSPSIDLVEEVVFACADHPAVGHPICLNSSGRPADPRIWTWLAARHNGLWAVAGLAEALARATDWSHAQQVHELLERRVADIVQIRRERDAAFDLATRRTAA